ncbi:PREDICTED: uncharacterized protein LOC109239372 [Nicotiana attenuata]|uniref:uncharacterized protein LOC109239372 n=1 Tax=Nicotiana attenuata TaxID=49451 RepID=UPI0009055E7F|nr:PREDICTED: uncharacterized protein LOC109239372 [Nicotiana attenuata]
MDFITGLPRSYRKFDSVWVIVNRLTKSAHFLPVRSSYTSEDYARLYIKEIVRLHGVPISIISDREAQFTTYFWRSFQKGLGTQMAPYEALCGRKCRSPIGWFDVGESGLHGPDLIQQAIEKCIGDPTQVVPTDDVQIIEDLPYEEIPVAILDRKIRKLRNKEIASMKVLWRSKKVEDDVGSRGRNEV